jgi:hypothetical protein
MLKTAGRVHTTPHTLSKINDSVNPGVVSETDHLVVHPASWLKTIKQVHASARPTVGVASCQASCKMIHLNLRSLSMSTTRYVGDPLGRRQRHDHSGDQNDLAPIGPGERRSRTMSLHAPVGSTNGTSLGPWWPVRNTVHGGQGIRLLAVHSRRQVPAIDRDSFLSALPEPVRVPHLTDGLF